MVKFLQTLALYIMTSKKQFPLPQNFKHQIDTRTHNEITLSNHLVRALSELNLSRIGQRQNLRQKSQQKIKLAYQYTFICIPGAPKLQKQFENLELPGQRIIHPITGMEGDYSDAESQQMFKNLSPDNEAIKLSKVIQKINPNRKVIIIFHSFGSFLLLSYLKNFGDQKIHGLIDMGGIPITMYSIARDGIKFLQKVTMEQLTEKKKQIYDGFIQAVFGKYGGSPFKNKTHGLMFMKFFKEKVCQVIFQWARNYPKMLKLIIFGRKDILFKEKLLNQKAVHYCYTNKLHEEREKQLQNAYEKVYGEKVKNVQQRFIFNIESGGHSIHYQPKLTKTLNNIIRQYIEVLDAHFLAQKTEAKL